MNARTATRALIWTGISVLLGFGMLAAVTQVLQKAENSGTPSSQIAFEVFLHLSLGVVALVCLPFVLYLDGRVVPWNTLRPKVLASEKLREFLENLGHDGEEFLAKEGSAEALQRRTGGWIPITLGLFGVIAGTISFVGAAAGSLLMISLTSRRSWTLALATLITAIAAQAAGFILVPTSTGSVTFLIFIINGSTLAIVAVIGVIRGSREQAFLDSAVQTLLRDRSRRDRAIAEVRRGIARDMHDSLSHHLSVIAMYSGALSVRQDLDPEAVRENARLIASSARRSGVELREVLTMLRGDDQGTVVDPDLEHLVAERGDTVELIYREPLTAEALENLGSLERTTIYRFAQEAITNAVKHAPGQTVRIEVAEAASDRLLLVARNPLFTPGQLGSAHPAGPQSRIPSQQAAQVAPIAGSGLGLLGLKERMEAMGGQLSVNTFPEFELRAEIPVQFIVEEAAADNPAPAHPASNYLTSTSARKDGRPSLPNPLTAFPETP